jgi:hypothetical protein
VELLDWPRGFYRGVAELFRPRIAAPCTRYARVRIGASRLQRGRKRVALQVPLPRDRPDPDPGQLIADW